MYPHERSLVKKLADKPFALLGVNSDPDRVKARKNLVEQEITWRSWWDNGDVNGPIHTQWQVVQRPTFYLIDANGVIRRKDLNADNLDKAIDQVLADTSSRQ